jgi:nitrogen regulatory protein PII
VLFGDREWCDAATDVSAGPHPNTLIWFLVQFARREMAHKPNRVRGVLALVQIIAMVKPFRAQAVLQALESIEILGGTVREAMGYGRQKNRLHRYLGSEYNASFLPKVEIAVFVHDQDVPAVLKTIVAQARTGRMGDGKILVLPCLGEFVQW